MPICTTARHKSKLVSDFRAVYRSFPDVFRSWDPDALAQLAQTNKRVVRQTLFLSSNYFHNLMLVHAAESGPDVPVNVRGTLEAAHDAITAFFVLYALFEAEARVWWVFNHRAFLEAVCMGNVLREVAAREKDGEGAGEGGGDGGGLMAKDPLFVRARGDIREIFPSYLIVSLTLRGLDKREGIWLTVVYRPHDTDHASDERGRAGITDGEDESAGFERVFALGAK